MSTPLPEILLIEDDAQIRRFTRSALIADGYSVIEAVTGKEGIREAAIRNPALIILDIGLPDLDGLEVTRRIREWSQKPIIVVSARTQETDKIDALNAGADDYLTKPFGVQELFARIRVALRRSAQAAEKNAESVIRIRDLVIDLAAHLVKLEGKEIHLTPIEYELLVALARNAGKVMTQRDILKSVWGSVQAERSHSLRVHMHQLRHKIEADPVRPAYIVTESKVGYRMKDE